MSSARFQMDVNLPLTEVAEQQILNALGSAVHQTAEQVAMSVRNNIISDGLIESGAMLNSVAAVMENEFAWDVEVGDGIGDPYPVFQEFGTGQRGSASGVEVPPGYVYGGSAGIDAHSFVRNALEEHQQEFVANLRQALEGG